MAIEKNKTGLIILGASEFPRTKVFEKEISFLNAKNRIRNYFEDKNSGISLEEHQILDLFDSDKDSDTQDMEITEFIKRQTSQNVRDIFLYYVGHGSFANKSFYLAIRRTRSENPAVSSITFSNLSTTVSKYASNIRTFIILDCCFSGGAMGFQFDSGEAIGRQIMDEFPSKGVALLCSTSKDLPALIVKEKQITMFTEGLDIALRKGDAAIKAPFLTLRQLHSITYSYIKQLNPGESTRPEVSSPIQPVGDIAEIPHFPNRAFSETRSSDILRKKREVEADMSQIRVITAANLFLDFVNNFDRINMYNAESVILVCDAYDLEDEKSSIEKDKYKERRNSIFLRMMSIMNDIIKQSPDEVNHSNI